MSGFLNEKKQDRSPASFNICIWDLIHQKAHNIPIHIVFAGFIGESLDSIFPTDRNTPYA